MTCLGCQACETGPTATLIDGRVVCTSCEDWRAECEARAVLAMPKPARRVYLFGDGTTRGVAQVRGQAAADALAALVSKVWEAGRGPAGGQSTNT